MMPLRMTLCVALLTAALARGADETQDLVSRVKAAKPLTVEVIGAPMRATRGGGIEWVPNPDGKTWDVLVRYYHTYWGPHTTVMIDLGTGQVKQFRRQSALYSRACMGPDGRYYSTITAPGGTGFQVYDPATSEISDLEAVAREVEGETRPLTIGTDGMIYGAGSSKSRAIIYQLDPATGKLTEYGHVGPSHAPNPCWGYTVAADDRYVYVASGKLPWYLVACDRQSRKDKVLLTLDAPRGYLGVGQSRQGCTALTKDNDGKVKRYWLYNGNVIEKKDRKEKPPWPTATDVKPWVSRPPRPRLGTGRLRPMADGEAELWWLPVENAAKMPRKPADDADPEALGWKVARFRVPTYPYPVTRVTEIGDGRVCGSGGNYLGNFVYDPKTGRAEHKGIIHLSHYTSAAAGGKVYMSGYPNAALFIYDTDKAWTANAAEKPWEPALREDRPESNPRRVAWLSHAGSGCHKMLAATSAADGKVYFGGRWYRNGIGGGLAWWDIKEGKAGGIYEPFINYQVHYMTTADEGRYVVCSTAAVRGAINNTPKPPQAQLLVFDTRLMKIVRTVDPVPGADWTGPVAGVGKAVIGITFNPAERVPERKQGRFALTYGYADQSAILYRVNVETGEVEWKKTLPWPVGFRTNENAQGKDGFDFRLGPDGMIWTYTGGRFTPCNEDHSWWFSYLGPDLCMVRVDPRDGSVNVLGKIDRPGEIAFSGRDVVISGGGRYLVQKNMHLRRIRNLVPE